MFGMNTMQTRFYYTRSVGTLGVAHFNGWYDLHTARNMIRVTLQNESIFNAQPVTCSLTRITMQIIKYPDMHICTINLNIELNVPKEQRTY